jgi:hypothetical protein
VNESFVLSGQDPVSTTGTSTNPGFPGFFTHRGVWKLASARSHKPRFQVRVLAPQLRIVIMKKTLKLKRPLSDELENLWKVFFPRGIHDKYQYLGAVPWNDGGDISRAMLPLVLLMDHKAKPFWCPRWFLRLLHLYGNDNSVVRVRNWRLHELYQQITKGYFIWDYKTKWTNYDLRISISGDDDCQFLSDSIEDAFYRKGKREELQEEMEERFPDVNCKGWNLDMLQRKLKEADDNEELSSN